MNHFTMGRLAAETGKPEIPPTGLTMKQRWEWYDGYAHAVGTTEEKPDWENYDDPRDDYFTLDDEA